MAIDENILRKKISDRWKLDEELKSKTEQYDQQQKYEEERDRILSITSNDLLYNNFFSDMHNVLNLEEEIQTWRYDCDKFRYGRYNVHPTYQLSPLFYDKLFNENKLLLLEEHERFIETYDIKIDNYETLSKYSDDPYPTEIDILKSRIYQSRTGFLRELDACWKMLQKNININLYKNFNMDLNFGIDIRVKYDNSQCFIAIEHTGTTSEYYNNKKYIKQNNFKQITGYPVIRLIAPRENTITLDVIPDYKIDELLKHLNDNTFNQLAPNYIL